ncbi:DUF2490 domain-containing protein [Citromicrobium bathyomarinum]
MRSVNLAARALPLAAATVLLQPSAALADESEFWIELAAKGDIAEGTSLKVEVEQRRKTGPDEYIVGAVVDHEIGDGFSLGGGIEIHDIDGFTEVRPYQQVGFSTGILSLRTRIEERFYDNSDRMALRLRQRVQLSDTIAPRLKASASAELLYQLRDRNDGGPERVDQLRFAAGLTYRVAERFEVSGGYLLQLRPRPGGDTYTHVPQLSAAYRF